jgi:hypothetical protein
MNGRSIITGEIDRGPEGRNTAAGGGRYACRTRAQLPRRQEHGGARRYRGRLLSFRCNLATPSEIAERPLATPRADPGAGTKRQILSTSAFTHRQRGLL